MKDDFDKRLSDRIAEVFDNYQDQSADAGWAMLRDKYPEKKKRRGVIWLWMGSAAAVLLLFLGLWIWNDQISPKVNIAATKTRHKAITDTTISTESAHLAATPLRIDSAQSRAQTTAHSPAEYSASLPSTQSQLAATMSKTKNQVTQNKAIRLNLPVQGKRNSSAPPATQTIAAIAPGKQVPMVSEGSIAAGLEQQAPVIINSPTKTQASQSNGSQTTSGDNGFSASADTPAKKNIAQNENRPSKPLVKSPFTTNDPIVKKDKTGEKANNSNKVSFGVYAATYLNYASGSSGQVNIGAGVASDIPVAKNLKLSAGLAVNQNSLNYGNHLPPTNGLDFAAASSPMRSFYSLVAPTALNTTTSYPFVLKNYSAQLTSLDIPLNLKYEFNPQKNSSFISFGLSSGTFITEIYNSQYSNAFSATQTQTTSTTNSFSGFAIAKTLDFSFGLGYPIGKNNLSIEPFVKYPLQGLGADQIRFGAGGLNLKFNFSNNKK